MQIKMSNLRTVALSVALVLMAASALAESGEVNVYTTREPGLIQPLLDTFTKRPASRSMSSSWRAASPNVSRRRAKTLPPT